MMVVEESVADRKWTGNFKASANKLTEELLLRTKMSEFIRNSFYVTVPVKLFKNSKENKI